MEDHALARPFEQRAKLRFRFAQGALRAFALGVVNDAGANQILALGRQAQQPDFGGNQPAVGSLVNPFENRNASGENLVGFFTDEVAGSASTRLKFRADIGRRQLGQL